MNRLTALLMVLLALAPLVGLAQVSDQDAKSDVVGKFVDAFNAQDVEAMAALVTEDVTWLSVGDGSITTEVKGKAALVAAMKEYFSTCPTCRSEIGGFMSSHERVSVVEVASWEGRDGPKSQRSIAVYEFSGLRIQRVYYFPAEAEKVHAKAERR